MDQSLLAIVADLDKPKRLKDRPVALAQLRTCWKKHYPTLIEILKSPEFDRPKDYRIQFGPLKELIWQVILDEATAKHVRDISFLADHPDRYIRRKFIIDVITVGPPFVIDLATKASTDTERDVREAAGIGLRNRSRKKFTKAFAKQAGNLLFDYLMKFPNDSNVARFEALKTYAPDKFARVEQELDKADPMRPLLRAIWNVADKFKSHRDAVSGFADHPAGYRFIYALNYVDADIRNGGISQLYFNSTWSLMPDAVAGAVAFKCDSLATSLRKIVLYYHQRGRSKLSRKLTDDFFVGISTKAKISLDDLENEYYESFDKIEADGVESAWERGVKETPQLFGIQKTIGKKKN